MKKRIASVVMLTMISAAVMGCLSGCGAPEGSAGATGADTAANEAAGTAAGTEAAAADTGSDSGEVYTAVMPTDVENAGIYVTPVKGMSDDFIRGMDVSSLLAEEASGVKYYDADGSEADPLKIMADSGINYIRVRVWVDPYDADGHGYGGGNCTAETAAELGARAAKYGMKTCVDFHYSDFWADPNKQMCPKAWQGMGIDDKTQALHDYTVDSLKKILDAGADVGMVQIGNETNHGMAGEAKVKEMCTLMQGGSSAVREVSGEYGRDIQVVVHFTTVDDPDEIRNITYKLGSNHVDYDVFGVSFYPYWHGSLTNLVEVLKEVAESHGVKTCVMETSYMYTGEDGDGAGNSVSEPDALFEYPVSVQGQATAVRDVCAAAAEAGALGVFYWEGAWIPVPSDAGSRSDIWQEYGSGWASSYAGEYDPDDAGKYWGGCSWENQAFFDFEGHKLESLDVFKYLKYGAEGDHLEVLGVAEPGILFSPSEDKVMPDTIGAIYNDPALCDGLQVTWDAEAVEEMSSGETGKFEIPGLADPEGIACSDALQLDDDGMIRVIAQVTVSNVNLLTDPSFEDEDHSAWSVTALSGADPTDYQNKSADAHTGDISLHFWSEAAMEFRVEQQVTVAEDGSYAAEVWMQGGDFDAGDEIYLYVTAADGTEYRSDPVMPDGWVKWKNPSVEGVNAQAGDTLTVGAYVKCVPKAWATIDDFGLTLQ